MQAINGNRYKIRYMRSRARKKKFETVTRLTMRAHAPISITLAHHRKTVNFQIFALSRTSPAVDPIRLSCCFDTSTGNKDARCKTLLSDRQSSVR